MFTSSAAIVLQTIPVKSNAAVIKLFTRQNGFLTCWANSIRGKTASIKPSVLQPLMIVNAVLARRKHQNLPVITEMQLFVPAVSIKNSAEKSSIAIFLSELLTKCFLSVETPGMAPQGEEHAGMFDFLQNAILFLNDTANGCANFHLIFMLQLAWHLGIFPKGGYSSTTPFLGLDEGVYCAAPPQHKPFLPPPESEWVSKLSATLREGSQGDSYGQNFDGLNYEIPASCRRKILEGLIEYFEIHAGTGLLKSHLVFKEL